MVIGWQLHAYDMPYIRRAVRAAAESGVTHLQLSHDIMMFLKHVTGDPLRPDQINEIIDLAHRHSIEVYVWIHAISHVPAPYVVDSRANLDAPGLWEHEAAEYATMVRLIPEVDGVILSFGDCCHYHMYNDNQVVTRMGKTERLLKYINVAHGALAARRKGLFVRDWAGGQWTIEAIHQSPPDVGVMTKTDIGDWQHADPHNPYIGAFPERRQLVEFDLCGEYLGRAWTPWCAPGYIQYRWRHAHSRGAIGAVGRVDVFDLGHHIEALPYGVPSEAGPGRALGTPNEVNLYAFTQLLQDPEAGVEGIWQAWAEERYGAAAAPRVIAALKRTADLAGWAYWHRAYVGLMKTLPTLGYLERVARSEGILGRVLEDFAPERALDAAMEEEYGPADALCAQCLEDVEAARSELAPTAYDELLTGFDKLRYYLVTWRQVHRAFIRYKLYEMQGRPDQHERLSVEMQRLLDLSKEIEARYGPNHWPSNPRRLRRLVAEFRDVSNYFQKQLLRKPGPDLEISVFQPR